MVKCLCQFQSEFFAYGETDIKLCHARLLVQYRNFKERVEMKSILPYEDFFIHPFEIKFIVETLSTDTTFLGNYNMKYYLELK